MRCHTIPFLVVLLWCIIQVNATISSDELLVTQVPYTNNMIANPFVKREQNYKTHRIYRRGRGKNKVYRKNKKVDCYKKQCPLFLKPCPKECPLSCGYVDSPDPCCPLLGKAVCPTH
ncbi:hypothetical protein BD560DRAFT_486676 [Blakeslea trispora]|nr:hypothetical protein BD560DRAFT_486676 [Blakeslea trispora]